MERRLAAILAADMVGYSRLMSADESGTIKRQKAHRDSLIDPKIAQYGGRVVKTTGDGLLVEFRSVVDATQCAIEIQLAMPNRETQLPEEDRIRYRIGINLGDIVIDGEDILGEGVNIAARLEGLAEPGGILISRPVHTQVKGRLNLSFEYLGEKDVKNIPEPVTVYCVVLDDKAAALVTPVIQGIAKSQSRLWPRAAAAVGVLVLALGGAIWWQPWKRYDETASIASMSFPLPEKPSLAVLPFANLSGNAEQEFLADGITSDLITDLSKFKNLFVIAANSTFTYKGTPVKVQKVAEELGVQYVLEGSVQQVGDTIRINAQLIDALSGRHLWADRYDDNLNDILAVQNRVVDKVVLALAVKLEEGERTRSEYTAGLSVENYELFARAQSVLPSYFVDNNDLAEARELFQKLAILEPEFAGGYAGLSRSYALGVMRGYTRSPGQDAVMALEFAEKAQTSDPEGEFTRLALADAQFAAGKLDSAIATLERLVRDVPSSADAHGRLGLVLVWAGRPDEAFDHIEAAARLNPYVGSPYLNYLGLAEFTIGRYDRVVAALEKNSARGGPIDDAGLAILTASYSEIGQTDNARRTLARLIERYPSIHLRSFWLLRNFARVEDQQRLTRILAHAEIPMDRPYTR